MGWKLVGGKPVFVPDETRPPTGDLTGQVGFNSRSNQWEYVLALPGGVMRFTGVQAPDPSASARISANASMYGANVSAANAAAQRAQEAEQWLKSFEYKKTQDDIANANETRKIYQQDEQIGIAKRAQLFLEYKGAYEQAQGLTAEYNTTQQRMFENSAKINDMQFQRQALQANLNAQVAIQNQNNQLAVQQATAQFEAGRQERLAALSKDIGVLAADPGDRAKLASTLLANSGWGRANTALAQGNQITDESLQPLAQDLGLREEIRAMRSPFTYTPIVAPNIPQFAGMTMPNFQTTAPPKPFNPNPTATSNTPTSTNFGGGMIQSNVPVGGATYNGQAIAGAWGSGGTPAPSSSGSSGGGEGGSGGGGEGGGGGGMAEGGMTNEEKFIVGDRRDGKPAGTEELIINPTKAPIKVVPNNELPKYFGGTMPQRYADGTDEPTGYALGKYLEQMTLAGRGDEALSLLKSHGYSPTPTPAPETKAPTGMQLPTTVIPVVQMQNPVNPYASDYETPLSYTPPVYNWGEQDMGYVPAPFNAVTTQGRPHYYGQAAIDEANRQYAYQKPGQVLPGYSADQRLRAGQERLGNFMLAPAFGAGNLALNALGGASRFLSRLYGSTPGGQERGFTGFDNYQRPLTPEQRIAEMGASSGGGYIPGYNYPMDVIGLEGYAEGTDYPRYANGTTDGSVFGELPMQDTTEARNFLTKSLQNALSGTPWTAANLPSAVYASTPGTDPVVAQILGSLNAQARGIPAQTFLRQASLLAPEGASQQVTRRSA